MGQETSRPTGSGVRRRTGPRNAGFIANNKVTETDPMPADMAMGRLKVQAGRQWCIHGCAGFLDGLLDYYECTWRRASRARKGSGLRWRAAPATLGRPRSGRPFIIQFSLARAQTPAPLAALGRHA